MGYNYRYYPHKKNIIGIALTGNLIILHQDFLYRLQPLTAAYVVCYDFQNEKHYALTPWFYLPELMQRNLILPYGSILFYPYKIVNFPIDNLLDKDIIKNHSQALIPVSYIRLLKKIILFIKSDYIIKLIKMQIVNY